MKRAIFILIGSACWFLLATSMGWYYTITYFGRVGWPMPSVETVGALLLYYFSVLNVPTETQAVHWLMVFPLAGLLWVVVFRGLLRDPLRRPDFARAVLLFGLATLPLSLPMPYLAWLAGFSAEGEWSVERMVTVALRRGTLPPWGWLSPMFFALGIVAFGVHLWVFWRLIPLSPTAAVRQYLLTCVVYTLVVSVAGLLLSYPLRALLE